LGAKDEIVLLFHIEKIWAVLLKKAIQSTYEYRRNVLMSNIVLDIDKSHMAGSEKFNAVLHLYCDF